MKKTHIRSIGGMKGTLRKAMVVFLAFLILIYPLAPLAVLANEQDTERQASSTIDIGDNADGSDDMQMDNPGDTGVVLDETPEGSQTLEIDPENKGEDDKVKHEDKTKKEEGALSTNALGPVSGGTLSVSALNPVTSKSLPDIDQNTGALKYDFPIAVPPGRNGMQPDLSITYNSSNEEQNSIFGYGWSINIPYIQRLNKQGIAAMYDAASPKSFYSSIDGELVSSLGTSYIPRTESGSFNKYTFQDDQWVITAKDGTVYKFGTDAASQQNDLNNPARIYKWMLREIRDTNNNYITFSYYKDAGQIYPETIKYTGNGVTDGIFEIYFARGSRTDNAIPSYSAGFGVTSNYYIGEIGTKVNGNWATKYGFSYGMNSTNTRMLLNSVIISSQAIDGSVSTLPAQTFTYQNSAPSWVKSPNLPSISLGFNAHYEQAYEYNFVPTNNMQFVDLNGDGLQDYVDYAFSFYKSHMSSPYGNSWIDSCYNVMTNGSGLGPMELKDVVIGLNKGTYWDTGDTAWNFPADNFFNSACVYNGMKIRFIDLNGDGLPDLVKSRSGTYSYPYSQLYFLSRVYLNNGHGWTDSSSWSLPIVPVVDGDSNFFADFNGDGLPDFAYYKPSDYKYAVALNNGNGWTSSSITIPFNDLKTQSIDLNGDGISEISRIGSNVYTYRVDADNKLQEFSIYNADPRYIRSDRNYITSFADYNNDGRPDVFSQFWNESTSNVFGWFQNTTTGFPMYGEPLSLTLDGTLGLNALVQFGDFNGDGLQDYAQVNSSISLSNINANGTVFINTGVKQDLLSRINYPLGGNTSVSYKSAAQYPNNKLPFPLTVVSQITNDDGLGNTFGNTYGYSGAVYYYNTAFDRQFAGFSQITQTDSAGNVTKNYFHTGKGMDSVNGEYQDNFYKIGKIYRIEQYNSTGNLYKAVINKWDAASLNANSSFVYLAQTVEEDFDGQVTHRDKAQIFAYDNATGNLTQKVDQGEVIANQDGNFSDTGSDRITANYTYAASAGSGVLGAVSGVAILDQNSNKVKESRFYYDNLAWGSVGLGNQTKKEDWISGANYINTRNIYNNYGLVARSLDPNGNAADYVFDSYNLYPAAVTNAKSQTTQYVYNYAIGKAVQITDPNGGVFATSFDGFGRVLQQQQPDEANKSTLVAKSSFVHTDASLNASVRETAHLDAVASVTSVTYYDGFGRTIQTKKSARNGNFVTKDFAYNNRGLLQKESLPYFTTSYAKTPATSALSLYTAYDYDALQRKVSVVNSLGVTSYAYNKWQTTITDANSNKKDYFNDAYGSLVKVLEHNGADTYTTTYAYDGASNLIGITDALGNLRSFAYDGLGRRLSAQDLHKPGAATFGTRSKTYDNAGNVLTSTDATNQTITYTYDSLNRATGETSGAEAVIYTYDNCLNGIGRLCQIISPALTETYEYSPTGKQTKGTKMIDAETFVTVYAYDRQGNQISVNNPDGSQINYSYNAAGLVEKIRNQEAGGNASDLVNSFDYSPLGQVSTVNYSSGAQTQNTYDAGQFYRLTRKISTANSSNLQDISYQYDAVGNIKQVTDNSATATKKTAVYGYDNLYRLTSVSVTNDPSNKNYSQSFAYDALGNMLTQGLNDTTLTYAYNAELSGSGNPDAVTTIITKAPLEPPAITGFAASPSSIPVGGSSVLSWELAGGVYDTLTIDNGIGSVLGKTEITVNPLVTTTYKLTATNVAGTVTATATVTVVVPPTIPSFTVSPTTINLGGSTTLSWTLGGGDASELSIDNGIGSVLGQNSKLVSPTANTTYKLTATNIAGSATKTVAVMVITPPVINTFTATPSNVTRNKATVLAWTLSGSAPTSLTISPNVGSVLGLNSKSVVPGVTTTYTLTATNSAGTVTKTVKVTVGKTSFWNGKLDKLAAGAGHAIYSIFEAIAGVFDTPVAYAETVYVTATANYQYDANGNLLSDGKNIYTYDYHGWLTRVTGPTMTTVKNTTATVSNYSYDQQGQRIKTVVTATTTDLASGNVTVKATATYTPTGNYNISTTATTVKNSGGTVISTDTSQPEVTKHVFANGVMTATIKGTGAGAKAYANLTDGLNSSTVVVDPANNVVEVIDYYPFGAVRFDNGTDNYSEKRKYIGQEYDAETNLSYLNARYYNGTIGRFVSEDPVFWGEQNLSDPQSLNAYSYANNNPITFSDPSGNAAMSLAQIQTRINQISAQVSALSRLVASYSVGFAQGLGNSAVGTAYALANPPQTISNIGNFAVSSYRAGSQLAADLYSNSGKTINEISTGYGIELDEFSMLSPEEQMNAVGNNAGSYAFGAIMSAGVGKLTQATRTNVSIGVTGRIGEESLKKMGGASQVYFKTSQGGRFVDQLANGVANESKVGRTYLTKSITNQIAKDQLIRSSGAVSGVAWHFYKSPVTGGVGPSGPLYKALEEAGFNVCIH